MKEQQKCKRAWPCRYRDARQCARDTMLGAECPKVCECACHVNSQRGEVYLSEIAVAAGLLVIIAIIVWQLVRG